MENCKMWVLKERTIKQNYIAIVNLYKHNVAVNVNKGSKHKQFLMYVFYCICTSLPLPT